MKKVCIGLVLLGLMGSLSSILLKLSDFNSSNLIIVSQLFILVGILLLPSLVIKKNRSYLFRQKLFHVILWLGLLLTQVSHLIGYMYLDHMHWDGYRAIALTGYSMILLYMLYVIVVFFLNKLRTKPIGKPAISDTLSTYGLAVNDLRQYLGVYINEKVPLKIDITQQDETLVAQATNQSAFYLEVVEKNVFKYPQRDIVLEFHPDKNELMLKQHGGYFLFLKEV